MQLEAGKFLIEDVHVGHGTDLEGGTGVTVAHFPARATAAAVLRGGATSTRQFDSLNDSHGVGHVDAICFTGGSAYGLGCSDGAMQWLRERGQGLHVRNQIVPIVPTAAIFDLFVGPTAPPTPALAYKACDSAVVSGMQHRWGSVGAGTGAAVGKLLGIGHASKGGIGCATAYSAAGFTVAAMVAVNAFGDILSERGDVIAGCTEGRTEDLITGGPERTTHDAAMNTTLALIATDMPLDKGTLRRVAEMAMQGFAWRIRPVFSPADGDLAVAVSVGKAASGWSPDAAADTGHAMLIGQMAAHAVAHAIEHGVRSATEVHGVRPRSR